MRKKQHLYKEWHFHGCYSIALIFLNFIFLRNDDVVTSKSSKQKNSCWGLSMDRLEAKMVDDLENLEDHRRLMSSWLPPFTSRLGMFRPFGRGTTLSLGDLLSIVIDHVPTGMILQVWVHFEGCKGVWHSAMKLSGHGEVESAFRSVGEPCHGCYSIGEVYDSMARCHLTMLRFF